MKYRINYSKVISQVNSIEQDVTDLSTQVRFLEQIEQECRAVWKSEAAEVFVSKLHTLRAELNRTKGQMSDLASTIRYCADKIQREDQKAEEQAAALRSGH